MTQYSKPRYRGDKKNAKLTEPGFVGIISRVKDRIQIASLVVTAIETLLMLALYNVPSNLKQYVVDLLLAPQHRTGRMLIFTAIISGISYLLFRFKEANKFHYGLFEIAFGIASAGISITRFQETHDANAMAAIIGSAYIIVRGFTNKREGEIIRKSQTVPPQVATGI